MPVAIGTLLPGGAAGSLSVAVVVLSLPPETRTSCASVVPPSIVASLGTTRVPAFRIRRSRGETLVRRRSRVKEPRGLVVCLVLPGQLQQTTEAQAGQSNVGRMAGRDSLAAAAATRFSQWRELPLSCSRTGPALSRTCMWGCRRRCRRRCRSVAWKTSRGWTKNRARPALVMTHSNRA